ncbi:MAG: thioredoxin family protein [bacterium]|nr:thioredoxin family protein [bacterium]
MAAAALCTLTRVRASQDPGAVEAPPTADWGEILGPAQGSWPEPQSVVDWRTDLADALSEARESNRPLLLNARCLPCKQCATLDQEVMEGTSQLTPLLSQFITVRLTDAFDLDLGLLDVEGFQDLDLSWWAYFLSPEGRTYGVFGGRDEVSDTTRVSVEALANTLRRVLDHHYDPRRTAWNVDGPAPNPEFASSAATDLAGYASWSRKFPEPAGQGCLHCHQLAEVVRQPALDAGMFDLRHDVAIWPFPENVGMALDRARLAHVHLAGQHRSAARIRLPARGSARQGNRRWDVGAAVLRQGARHEYRVPRRPATRTRDRRGRRRESEPARLRLPRLVPTESPRGRHGRADGDRERGDAQDPLRARLASPMRSSDARHFPLNAKRRKRTRKITK